MFLVGGSSGADGGPLLQATGDRPDVLEKPDCRSPRARSGGRPVERSSGAVLSRPEPESPTAAPSPRRRGTEPSAVDCAPSPRRRTRHRSPAVAAARVRRRQPSPTADRGRSGRGPDDGHRARSGRGRRRAVPHPPPLAPTSQRTRHAEPVDPGHRGGAAIAAAGGAPLFPSSGAPRCARPPQRRRPSRGWLRLAAAPTTRRHTRSREGAAPRTAAWV